MWGDELRYRRPFLILGAHIAQVHREVGCHAVTGFLEASELTGGF